MEEYHQITLNEYISIKEDIKRRLNHLAEKFCSDRLQTKTDQRYRSIQAGWI